MINSKINLIFKFNFLKKKLLFRMMSKEIKNKNFLLNTFYLSNQ